MSSNANQDLSKRLLKLMQDKNRPFAFNEIHQQLGALIGKASLQKCINHELASQRIIEKTYGKQTIYCVNNKVNDSDSGTVGDE